MSKPPESQGPPAGPGPGGSPPLGTVVFGEHIATLDADDLTQATPNNAAAQLPFVDPRSYRITGAVAQGGIGRILRARDERLDRPVALKEPLTSTGAVAEERFIREALLTARLQHPAIIPLYEAGRWPDGSPFYAMKYVSGRSLADVITDARTLEQRLALLPHVLAIAEAMAYAHSEGIIHRDLKPSNVLVGPFGETVVIDWGLAKDLGAEDLRASSPPGDAARAPRAPEKAPRAEPAKASQRPPRPDLTMLGAVMGTPAYMPPEQASGERVDERADVYAVGAILYHLLSGACPYDGKSSTDILQQVLARPPRPLEERQKGIAQDLLTIASKAMSRDPADRYPSAKELADDLRRFQTGQIVGAHKYSSVELFRRFARRYRAALSVAAAALVVLAVTFTLAMQRNIAQRILAEAGFAAAMEAQREAIGRADDLTLVQARAAALRDPNEALAWLKSLSPGFARWPEARLIAADAEAHGVANVLRGHTEVINEVLFSPDGRRLVTTSDDHTARIWELRTGESLVLSGHADEVWLAAFSPSGRRLATTSQDRTVRIWNVGTGEEEQVLRGFDEPVNVFFTGEETVAVGGSRTEVQLCDLRTGQRRVVAPRSLLFGAPLSADGRRLSMAGEDGVLRVYDREQGALWSSTPESSPLLASAISSNGDTVVSQSRDGVVRRWSLPGGANLGERQGESQVLSPLPSAKNMNPRLLLKAFRLSSDGKLLAGTDGGTSVFLWDLTTGARRALEGHEGRPEAMAFSPDGKRLASGSFDHTVRLWDLESGESRALRGFDDAVFSVAFSPDSRFLAAASADHTVRIFPVSTVSDRIFTSYASPLLGVVFSPDGKRLLVRGREGAAVVVDLASDARVPLEGHGGDVYQGVFSPEGDLVATAGADGTVRVWDLEGHEIWAMKSQFGALRGGPDILVLQNLLAFSPDGKLLAAPGEGAEVQILDIDSGVRRSLAGHTSAVVSLAFSKDGKRLASGSADATVRLWELESGASRVLSSHTQAVIALALSSDGRTLASGSLDHTLVFWDTATGQGSRHGASGGGVEQIVLSRDGKTAHTLSIGETGVRVWNVETGAESGYFHGHSGPVCRFSLSRDERRLATASVDGTLRIWDIQSQKSRVLRGHTGVVREAAFSPDGKFIVSVSEDRTARLWPEDLPEDGALLRQRIEAAVPDTIESYRHPAEP